VNAAPELTYRVLFVARKTTICGLDRSPFAERRQGQHPSISVSSAKLRKVRITMMPASSPTLSGEVIVEIISAHNFWNG
jgi:hypothetical protein